MNADPNVLTLALVTLGVGYLMTVSGLQKSALELRRKRRVCPSCGRYRSRDCSCG